MKKSINGTLFIYDRLIDASDICNFTKDIASIKQHVEKGRCLRLYGRRNFGKTSIVKNVIAPAWEAADQTGVRVPLYIDLYAIQSIQDISQEFTKAFNLAITRKQTLFEKGLTWAKALKHVRPTWQPPSNGNDFGEFSIKTEKGSEVVDFQIILENMKSLSQANKFKFLLILDEFQQVSEVRQAEAKLRAGLQELDADTPVIILGSKQHMLDRIFNRPKAPFHAWGTTIELKEIAYHDYHLYMNKRFQHVGKSIDLIASTYLQNLMNRIPESINRFCDAIAEAPGFREITVKHIDDALSVYLENTMSIYSAQYANFSASERKVLHELARIDRIRGILSSEFIGRVGTVSKSGIDQMIKRFLDHGIVYREITADGIAEYLLADPLFKFYLRKYKIF